MRTDAQRRAAWGGTGLCPTQGFSGGHPPPGWVLPDTTPVLRVSPPRQVLYFSTKFSAFPFLSASLTSEMVLKTGNRHDENPAGNPAHRKCNRYEGSPFALSCSMLYSDALHTGLDYKSRSQFNRWYRLARKPLLALGSAQPAAQDRSSPAVAKRNKRDLTRRGR